MRYQEIASRVNVSLCEGPCDWGSFNRHVSGGVYNATVHWRRERVTRAGIYDFLKLCSRAEHPLSDLPFYEQVWAHSTYATRTARSLGIVVPSIMTRQDRLQVRSQLPPEIPSSNVIYKWVHKEAI